VNIPSASNNKPPDTTKRHIHRPFVRPAVLLATGGLLISVCLGCRHDAHNGHPATKAIDYSAVDTPGFNADSAYHYVAQQVAFGPRTPGSDSHRRCAEYLTATLQRWCDTVVVQPFTTTLWDGRTVKGRNIIASLNKDLGKRILLAAHWDSRLWADHDSDDRQHRQPIDGANDGASGVGVILELARCMSQAPPSIGIDFILFDVEDQGSPEWADAHDSDTWCKGSQYWAQHPHQPYYSALYGILYDMVGTPKPRFTQEEISRQFASTTLNKVWDVASALGYGNIFLNQKTEPILDDHYYINRMANIPTIDIVQNSEGYSFFPHWHTTSDNLDCIDSTTLKIVGSVTLKTIYGDYPSDK